MSLRFSGIFKQPDAGIAPMPTWKQLLPSPVKIAYHLTKERLRDFKTGTYFKFAKPSAILVSMPHSIELVQPIVPNAWLQNKQQNFRLAAASINAVTLKPHQVFSFWKTVGNPTAKMGYKKGRNLVNGQVSETYGGGLCQLSGILYHTSLLAGLAVLERHNHSVDLYANGEQRFTPLGADATVAFGYKDLRVANQFGFAVRFEVEVVAETLVCRLRSEKPIPALEIEFNGVSKNGMVEVETMKRMDTGELQQVGRSVYRVP
jgi:vancomycin resistance protein VanW